MRGEGGGQLRLIYVLIRQMIIDDLLWGALRIHGELLKLSFEVAQSNVAKYMVKRWAPPSQGWRIFLRNHARKSQAWICLRCRPSGSACSTPSSSRAGPQRVGLD